MEPDVQQKRGEDSYKLILSTNKGTYYVLPEQIVRLEASSNYTRIFISNQRPLVTTRLLKEYEEMLEPYGFVRTHRSHLVNKRLVMEIDKKGRIKMQDMSVAEISRRKKTEVMKALRQMSQS